MYTVLAGHLKIYNTVKPVLCGHSKKDKTKDVKTRGSLMQVKGIAECFMEHSATLMIIGIEKQFLVSS